jgi:hypothetical protein
MDTDLLELLGIDRSLIPPEAQRSLTLAETVWRAEGCPRDTAGLCGTLETILRRCTASGTWYAPVLLQRKKALERGTWRPRNLRAARAPLGCAAHDNLASGKQAAPPTGAVPQQRQTPSADSRLPATDGSRVTGEACARCGGTGIAVAPGGASGSLCPCGAYLRRFTGKAQPSDALR